MKRRIVLALSCVFSVRGGIPRFNQLFCRAVDELAPELGLQGSVASLLDRREDYLRSGAGWKRLEFVPGGGQLGFAVRVFFECVRSKTDALLIGHLGMTPLGLFAWPFLSRGYAFVAHGIEAWDERRFSRRFAARGARVIFVVSKHTGEALSKSTGVRADFLRCLPNALDPNFDFTRFSESNGQDGVPGELLTVSRLWAEEKLKGVDHTLTAFARIAERFPEVRYRIVGEGSDKPRLRNLAASLGIADRVFFEENLSDEELADRYRRCSLFVLPSGQEGFGIVFLEAMRYGKPCIGGAAGGTPEVIEDGVTGLLVPYGDVAALEAALVRLLESPELRRAMGRAGRERLLREFTYERFRDRLRGYLAEWLDLSAGGSKIGTPSPGRFGLTG
jgi:glycosyltransferase involved in cell wall biosynthesis